MEPKIRVNGTEYPLILEDDMTLGEAAEAEEIAGQGWNLNRGGYRTMRALAFISLKRAGVPVTLDDIDQLKVSDPEAFDLILPEAGPVPTASGDEEDTNGESGNASSSLGSVRSQADPPEITGSPA